jgi:hypothetical protein
MTRQKVTDPALLAQLGQSPRQKVTDPELLKKLNGDESEEDAGAYLDSLPEPEGFFHKLPRNIAIGAVHAGRNLHNAPHDIVQTGENALQQLGHNFDKFMPQFAQQNGNKNPLSSHLPYDPNDYAAALGQEGEGTLMDQLIQKGVEHGPEIYGGGGLIRGGFRRLKGTHQLDEVRRAARNLPEAFNYPPEMIQGARRYMPRGQATEDLIQNSQRGGYQPSFDVQSQVGHHQRQLANSPLVAERRQAPLAGDLKQSMVNHLERVFRHEGMHEEADMLRQGINNYGQYMRIKNAVMPALKKFGIPTSILAALGFGYKKVKQAFSD